MKAIGFIKHGGPEVLEWMDLKDPVANEGEVVVKTSFTSVNTLDTLVRKGYAGLKLSMPHITGADVVGTVESVGKGVQGFEKGEVVVANSLFGCAKCKHCKGGNEVLCSNWISIGRDGWGSYAQKVKVPARALIKPTRYFKEEELACMPLSLGVVWRGIKTLANAKEGQTILVRTGSGNSGLFSVKIAKAMGLRVIAASRFEEKRKLIEKEGADLVIDSKMDLASMAKEIDSFTKGDGVDIIVENIGYTLNDSVELINQGGTILSFGTFGVPEIPFKFIRLYLKSARLFGLHNSNKSELEDAMKFLEDNSIRPKIAKIMPLEEAANAHREFETFNNFGKIVLSAK